MTTRIVLAIALLSLVLASAAMAQTGPCGADGCIENPADSDSGNGGLTCWRCVIVSDTWAYCEGSEPDPWEFPGRVNGRTGCSASGPVQPPMYARCEVSGGYCYSHYLGQFHWNDDMGMHMAERMAMGSTLGPWYRPDSPVLSAALAVR